MTSPTYKVGSAAPLGYLDSSVTYDRKNHAVYLNVLNRSEKTDMETRIDNVTGKLGSSVEVWQMNGSDLKATHTFGADKKVRPTTKSAPVNISNNGFTFMFPKHSLTILKLKVD